MIFYKLNKRHKKLFILNQLLVFILIVIAVIVAMAQVKVSLPTNEAKLSASMGFILITFVMVLAIMNRLGTLFKLKSFGMLIFFLLFVFLDKIIDPVKIATGYILIPLLIDDIIFKPIWNNIWYNNYDN